jgi:hypothetical protein
MIRFISGEGKKFTIYGSDLDYRIWESNNVLFKIKQQYVVGDEDYDIVEVLKGSYRFITTDHPSNIHAVMIQVNNEIIKRFVYETISYQPDGWIYFAGRIV